jgi:hypothetical protein
MSLELLNKISELGFGHEEKKGSAGRLRLLGQLNSLSGDFCPESSGQIIPGSNARPPLFILQLFGASSCLAQALRNSASHTEEWRWFEWDEVELRVEAPPYPGFQSPPIAYSRRSAAPS